MDAGMAERLAASMDPKALGTLQNRNGDPMVARAVAAQFGSFLMQGMMQDSDGSAMSIAGGTGGAAVSSMFASAMGRYAMSGDKLGLADTIYRSMAAKGAPQPDQNTGNGDSNPAPSRPSSAPTPTAGAVSPTQGAGISLTPYWQDRGHRPFGASIGRMTQPAGVKPSGKPSPDAGATTTRGPLTTAAHHPAKTPPVAQVSVPLGATAPAGSPTSPPVKHMHWAGLSLPPQAHALLPPAETDSPVSTAAAGPTSPESPAAIATAPAAGGIAGSNPIPYGLPWTHRGGAESGAPVQHNAAATGAGASNLAEAENFTEELAPAIQQAAAKLGVSPRVLLAQAALETGWGHSVVGNNVFGVKAGASWSGATVTAGTHEMENGHLVAHRGTFRSYANVSQAVDDYVNLVSASNRYRAAIGSGDNIAAYAQALAAGGYASDRDYAAKLMAVANSPKMSYAVASLDDDSPGRLVSAHG